MSETAIHPTIDQLDAGLDHLRASPTDHGTVELVLRRPAVGEHEVLDRAELRVGVGVVGDDYLERGSSFTPDGSAHPEAQLDIMSSRAVDLVALGDRERWTLAGDQLFVDLDLSVHNLPVGTHLRIGTAVIEVAAKPHNGCAKFRERFGIDAARWVNQSKEQRRRGLCAMVVEEGIVRPGDGITKLAADVIAHVRQTLAAYKSPKRIVVVDTIGRAPNGKVDYKRLKAEATETLSV